VRITTAAGACVERSEPIPSPEAVLRPVLESLWHGPAAVIGGPREIDVVGHRVVHGGRAFQKSTRITPEVKQGIRRLADFAPEHNRLEVEAIEAAECVLGTEIPQVAVFDTAFHRTMPPAAATYPGPRNWSEQGIHRYGFHGISHQYTSRRTAEILGHMPHRMITAHLGNGCSLAAIRDGASIDTTMGFTPLEGLMMGTRSGSVDPGIVIFLVRHRGMGADQLDHILNKESGLKGLSGVSSDMREVLAARERGDANAALAFDVFVHRLCREAGGLVASLQGLDALVFTAGIGENSAPVRLETCRRFSFLGIELDEEKNARSPVDEDIARAGSPVRVLVVRTEEDWEIARECYRIIRGQGTGDRGQGL
jgi:acetate kinase